ncbi:MAG: MarR family transcriptional regulator [Mycobacterium sp.]
MSSSYDRLDDALARIHAVRQRPSWRRRLFEGHPAVGSLPALRVLRAVERHESTGDAASVGDVAEYLAVEHSTASRLVGGVVASGLLSKSVAPDDQRRYLLALTEDGRRALGEITDRRRQMVADVVDGWLESDVEMLLGLLDRLADDFERGPGA